MNEGFATWVHCYILNRLYDKELIDDGAMLEFAKVNSDVLTQLPYSHKQYSGFNPYALGLSMFRDIERICKDPTKEDRIWFPDIAGEHYIDVIKDAVANYRDESFILQFLSPTIIKKFKMFHVGDIERDEDIYEVKNIHNENGYRAIRQKLAQSYEIGNLIPDIQVVNANLDTDRILELHHTMTNNCLLNKDDINECLKHIKRLWGFEPLLVSYNSNKKEIENYTL